MKTGVWIDGKKAIIVKLENETYKVETLYSSIDAHERFDGESSDVSRFGNQPVGHEKSKHRKHEREVRDFAERVMRNIDGSEELVVFGPAGMKMELKKSIVHDSRLSKLDVDVLPADKMSENQIIAWVKMHYQQVNR